jgi:hypothetical protein
MEAKVTTRLLGEGQINALVKYLKAGNKIQNICLMNVVDLLNARGITVDRLVEQGVIVNLGDLLSKVKTQEFIEKGGITAYRFLKHYGTVLEQAIAQWGLGTLKHSSSCVDAELDKIFLRYLTDNWTTYTKSGVNNCGQIITYIETCANQHSHVAVEAFKGGNTKGFVTAPQMQEYRQLIAQRILNLWITGSEEISGIKARLDDALFENILCQSKRHPADDALSINVKRKLHEALLSHLVITDDLHCYHALSEKFKSIYTSINTKNHWQDYSNETINIIIENYSRFNAAVQRDIDKIMRNEVIPFISNNTAIPTILKEEAVSIIIEHFLNKRLQMPEAACINTIVISTITEKVRRLISCNEGDYSLMVKHIIREVLIDYKGRDHSMRAMLPDLDIILSDIFEVLRKIHSAVDLPGRLNKIVDQINIYNENLQQTAPKNPGWKSTMGRMSAQFFNGKNNQDGDNDNPVGTAGYKLSVC